jgi:pseudo-response regulator 1
VISVLNCEGAEMDIILAEVDLPVSKCFKMLKYIARNKELRHIPIISKLPSSFILLFSSWAMLVVMILVPLYGCNPAVMSNRDDVSVVVKCLRLGAAEYLVKPLRMNELLNLWTHVWRRRRMVNDTILFTFTCV